MRSAALRRFEQSMAIGYEQWHDGVGYDLEALSHLSEREKRIVERKLVPRAAKDWRDLEALGALGTPAALQAILSVRREGDPQIRLQAHNHGPDPSAAEWDAAIVGSLTHASLTTGLIDALRCAIAHPSPAVVELLWSRVSNPSPVAYHCGAALCCIAGISPNLYDETHQALLHRLMGPASEARSQAVEELRRAVNQAPARPEADEVVGPQ